MSLDYALPAVGLMNSIMFPTIYSHACEKPGVRAANGSSTLKRRCDHAAGDERDGRGDLGIALALPAVCYAVIAGFGMFARKPSQG